MFASAQPHDLTIALSWGLLCKECLFFLATLFAHQRIWLASFLLLLLVVKMFPVKAVAAELLVANLTLVQSNVTLRSASFQTWFAEKSSIKEAMVVHIFLTPTSIFASLPRQAAATASMGAHAVGAARRPLLLELHVPSRAANDAIVGCRILRAIAFRFAREAHSTIVSSTILRMF